MRVFFSAYICTKHSFDNEHHNNFFFRFKKIVNSKIKLNDFNLEGTNLQCSLPSRVQIPIEFELET